MSRRGGMGLLLFLAGVAWHAAFARLWTVDVPAPQWLLLAAVAAGGMGHTVSAQILGFLWGLWLDAQGAGLFGAQGWVLAAAGYAAGRLSREIDADKPSAQLILGAAASVFSLAALGQIELAFRAGRPHVPSSGRALVQVLLNLAAAPAVFRAVRWWSDRAGGGKDAEGRVFHA